MKQDICKCYANCDLFVLENPTLFKSFLTSQFLFCEILTTAGFGTSVDSGKSRSQFYTVLNLLEFRNANIAFIDLYRLVQNRRGSWNRLQYVQLQGQSLKRIFRLVLFPIYLQIWTKREGVVTVVINFKKSFKFKHSLFIF